MARFREGTTYAFLIMGMVFWGMSFIWYKQAYKNFTPITLIFLRLAISTPLLLISALALKRLRWPRIKDLPAFMFLALFEPFLYFIGESFGMLYVSSTLAAILIAIIPLITPFVGYYFFKERLTLNNYLGILVSFMGVILVVYVERASGKAPWYGIMLILLAVFSTQGIKQIGITKAVVFTNFIPIVTAVFALFILKENISFIKAIGILITITGLFMTQASGWPRIRIFSRVR